MKREHEELIELGLASTETKGSTKGNDDHLAGLIQVAGLSGE